MNTPPLSLELVTPGMVLAKEIQDHRGTLLISAGAVISEALIARLKKLGIDSVCVKDETQNALREEEARLRLAHLFRRVVDDDLTRSLERVILEFRKEQIK